ncbi:acetolactate decarboxylase [Aeromonas dhakensis]|uniref:acetolactate decarboxylase n=1 Tax=Aeromonas TaxID=642 RepID=UPI00002DDEFE|nr:MULTISPECIES: acetolactate decarboxylase [Aeromonas]AHV36189.1 alpha-acetolactate decarboxylase [Aeromonas hydrophila YL17]EIM1707514.1 acetolactate decarboxylase [Aeromonas dhakensis]MBL0534499.1 acetolactate decarboxylase [Aeromonas dhakensis]MBL0674717.1 acetolactate decarboxylase [Aeromonas dhakensis]MBL0680027.1 acetolactate decarboxylase [Aeromonas dhakensis]
METNSSCDCAIEISQQFARWQARQGGGEVYQSSLMSALLAGVYEGETTMADLLRHGDFGLGTFNRLDGELIAFERQIHQLKADGSARPARAEQKTPFAVMTHFRPCLQRRFDHPLSREEIHQWVDRLVGTDNVFVAFRLDGLFEQAQVRTVPCQHPPYKPMLEAIEAQPLFSFSQRRGTLVGFRCPPFVQGINVAGYHEHFITEDRRGGGHILDYAMGHGQLQLSVVQHLNIELPRNPAFQQADLNPADLDRAIRAAEG